MALDDRDYMKDRIRQREAEEEAAATNARYNPKQFRGWANTNQNTNYQSVPDSRHIITASKILSFITFVATATYLIKSDKIPIPWHKANNNDSSAYLSNKDENTFPLFSFWQSHQFPQSGTTRQYVNIHPSRLISSVTITTAGGHSNNYVIRFRHAPSGQPVIDAYIQPGQSMKLWLPEGQFETAVFSGTRWLGPDKLFSGSSPSTMTYSPFDVQPDHHYVVQVQKPNVSVSPI